MPNQPIRLEDLEGVRRVITSVEPHEVSIVDAPANLQRFDFVKNEDGTAAAIAELKKTFEAQTDALKKELEDLKKAAKEMPYPPPHGEDPKKDEEEAKMKKSGEAIADTIFHKVVHALEERGVIQKAKTPEERIVEIEKSVKSVVDGTTKAFEDLGKIVKALADKVEKQAAGDPAPASQQTKTTDVDLNKAAGDKDKDDKAEGGNLLSTMLFKGFGEKPADA